jgi:hypothetical protein
MASTVAHRAFHFIQKNPGGGVQLGSDSHGSLRGAMSVVRKSGFLRSRRACESLSALRRVLKPQPANTTTALAENTMARTMPELLD